MYKILTKYSSKQTILKRLLLKIVYGLQVLSINGDELLRRDLHRYLNNPHNDNGDSEIRSMPKSLCGVFIQNNVGLRLRDE